ncbi:non-specific serine/threonine protein kinase [Bifidobacterium cuniculi]|uniref:non-specific serine/threonine protein kinase n=2 Tax=Bifidobacterium cuniculi TaxID=1688 RepID=A0A087B3Q2_9BIFI|nr:non-specific serine/threonine protein kinase [Bifidobacterium cuniculi]
MQDEGHDGTSMNEASRMYRDRLVDGRYRIIDKIADGGMASVYRAEDTRLDREVALKVMHAQYTQGPDRDRFVQRFHREAKSAAAIANPHVVQVYDTGCDTSQDPGIDYLVMEYVHGVNLRYELRRKHRFSVRETLRIVGEVLAGLAAAHRSGIVHRDVKPENVLINDRGRVQITDFGLAKATSQATLSTTTTLMGTASYLAPEMIEHNQATPQGDCYSVGIMAWEMLTGRLPFQADNPTTIIYKHVHENVPSLSSVCPGIDPRVSRFVSDLTARDIHGRPGNAQAALEQLRQLMASLTPGQLSYRYDPDAPRPTRQDPGSTTVYPLGLLDSIPSGQPDSQPTQATTSMAANQAPTIAQPRNADRRKRGILIGAGAAGAAVLLGLGTWLYFAGPGSYVTMPRPTDLSCPSNAACAITGVPWDGYEAMLKQAGIPYTTMEQYDDDLAAGTIIATDPADVGDKVNKRTGQAVKVIVSRGVKQATVPQDIMDVDDPVEALRKAGFDKVTQEDEEWSATVPAGRATYVSEDPGATLDHDTPITVVVSKGPMAVSMPDVVGMSETGAVSELENRNLTVEVNQEYSDTMAEGKVIGASADAGASLHWGDTVTLTVSRGPEEITMPKVTGLGQEEAKATLEELGFQVEVGKTFSLSPSDTVVSQDPEAGTTVRLRDRDGNPTVVTLKIPWF